jgi:hypothetical protein
MISSEETVMVELDVEVLVQQPSAGAVEQNFLNDWAYFPVG